MIGDLETQSHQQIAPVLPENQRLIEKPNKNVISDDRSNEDTLSTTLSTSEEFLVGRLSYFELISQRLAAFGETFKMLP